MGVDAFVMQFDLEDQLFATQFLASTDFDQNARKAICKSLRVSTSLDRMNQIGQIANLVSESIDGYAPEKVIEQFILRKKGWVALKTGKVNRFPRCATPDRLLLGRGTEQWYGPINCSEMDVPSAHWYIRPVFIPHWQHDSNNQPQQCYIRWHCFARVEADGISLHWRGFSHSETLENISKNSQFNYWDHVPKLFYEIEELTNAKVKSIELQRLLLHDLWDDYRGNPEYRWIDRRIRAESSGVSLKAHAGIVYEIEAGGLLHLASTIRRSIQRELKEGYNYALPDEDRFDEVILRTLIREYGTLSYEFSLEHQSELLFNAHGYFGMKQHSKQPDCFPHLNLHVTKCHDLDQLRFLKTHWMKYSANSDHEDNSTQPLSLF